MIINMWWFYFIDLLQGIKFALASLLGVSGVVLVISFMVIEDSLFDSEQAVIINLKKWIFAWIVLLFVATTIPSEDTMYKMLIAQNVTYENVELAGDMVTDVVDYIIEKVDVLLEKEK